MRNGYSVKKYGFNWALLFNGVIVEVFANRATALKWAKISAQVKDSDSAALIANAAKICDAAIAERT